MRPIVPEFIVQKACEERQSGHFNAATLFVDCSGFSAMTEGLAVHGQHGAEVLATIVGGIFDPLVASVFAQGGFVIGFSGDAFTAVFPEKDDGFPASLRCLAAAQDMQTRMSARSLQETPYGEYEISIKIGLAWGETVWEIFKSLNGERAAFLFRGPAIDGASLAEHHAQPGQILLTPIIADHLEGYVNTAPAGEYLRLVSVLQSLPLPAPFDLPRLEAEAVRAFCPPAILSMPSAGEFRQVVNVFIDIPLSIDSAGDLEKFMQAVFRLQQRYGGYFLRPDFGDKGSNLLIFWGAPTAFENDIDRALNFLLDLCQETNLLISAGVTYFTAYAGFMGSSLREDYTCYGRGVNLAARFMQASPKGEIWLDEEMARRAARNFELRPVGEMQFKGFRQNQRVYSLLRRKERTETIYHSKMVGRKTELARLVRFVAPIWEGRSPGVMMVRGEAGIGKSRLVHGFQELPQFAPFRSCWGVCQTDEILRQPFNPFRYYLKNYFALRDDMSEDESRLAFDRKLDNLIERTASPLLKAELDRTRSVLGALLNLHWPDSLYEQLDAQGRYENTVTALSVLLRAESLSCPLVLIIEDVHWLDSDSANFLRAFVRILSSDPETAYPIALIVTARPEGHPFELDDPSLLSTLDLASLAEPDLDALVADLLGGPAAPELLAILEQRAEGNPFFAEQILRYLQEEQALRKDPDGYRVILPQAGELIPTDVRAILIARLDRLAQNVREVVQTASILGREFEVRLLAEMLRGDSALLNEVEEARQADIWLPLNEIRYIFCHALLRDAAYAMQLQVRQKALHELAVSALEALYHDDLPSHYGELAYHSEHAGLVGKAVAYLELAGQAAAQRYENSQALDYYNRALALVPEDDLSKRFELINSRAHIYSILGQRENQSGDLSRLAELAEALNDAHHRALAAVSRVRYLHQTGDFPALIEESERTVGLANASGDVKLMLDVYIAWNQALARLGRNDEAVLQAQAGLEVARQAGFRSEEGALLNGLGLIAIERRDPAAARQYFEQGLKIAREIGHRHLEAQAVNNLGNYHAMVVGDFLAGQDYFLQAFHLAEEMGDRMGQGLVLANLGWISGLLGDFGRAAEYHQRALSIAREVGNRYQEAYTLLNLSAVAGYQGNGQMALDYASQGLRQIRSIGDQNGEGWAQLYLGNACFLESDYQRAREAYQAALNLRTQLNQPSLKLEPLAGLVECALAAKKPEEALVHSQAILDHFAAGGTSEGAEEPLRVYLACYQGLQENGDERARRMLQDGYALLLENVNRLTDGTARRMYVENVPWRRAVKETWEQIQAG